MDVVALKLTTFHEIYAHHAPVMSVDGIFEKLAVDAMPKRAQYGSRRFLINVISESKRPYDTPVDLIEVIRELITHELSTRHIRVDIVNGG